MSHWAWLTAGVLALAAELLLPGVYLLWLGLAAVAVGVLTWLLPLSWLVQVMLFSVLAVIAVLLGRRYYAAKGDEAPGDLNRRDQALKGRKVRLVEAIRDGEGMVYVDDTRWPALGADAEAGTLVEIVGVEGARVRVRPA